MSACQVCGHLIHVFYLQLVLQQGAPLVKAAKGVVINAFTRTFQAQQ